MEVDEPTEHGQQSQTNRNYRVLKHSKDAHCPDNEESINQQPVNQRLAKLSASALGPSSKLGVAFLISAGIKTC